MTLAHRTDAAVLFEKGLDPENVETAIRYGINLFVKYAGGVPEGKILDIYPQPEKTKKITVGLKEINNKLGISLTKSVIAKILSRLEFKTTWHRDSLEVIPPSYRAKDINIAEDIIEEIARIYGYHNLPSQIMDGVIPDPKENLFFEFENKVKRILKGYGGIEIYSLSLVSKEAAGDNALKLKNPLGSDSEYLRTSLIPSLISAVKNNPGEKEAFNFFEIANIYLPRKNDLPDERTVIGNIFANYDYRKAKGTLESLLLELHIDFIFEPQDLNYFLPGQRLVIKSKGFEVGQFGVLENNGLIYYELDLTKLIDKSRNFLPYQTRPLYPAQLEDITFVLPDKTKVGEVLETITKISERINNVELKDIYENANTFRIWYQDKNKTLNNEEVNIVRQKVIAEVQKKFGGTIKN
jgi:phenylalanyl-tRNA synthetase beta chain